jgi:FixJ family two-component response regulator
MSRQLVDQRERLVQAERVAAWRELARRLAHELKNPLFPLRVTLDNLRRAKPLPPPEFDEVFDESVDTLTRGIGNLNTVIGRFSDFARMPVPDLSAVSPNTLVEESLALFRAQLSAPGAPPVETTVDLDPDAGHVRADGEQLARSLQNLILNAIDAMPSGGPALDSHAAHRRHGPHRRVRLRAGTHRRGAQPPVHALLHHQGTRHRARPRDRPVGRGRSPRQDLGGQRTGPGCHVPHRAAGRGSRMTRVLIVDDDPSTLASLSRAFRLAGHEAVVCDNAARGIELVRAERFDVVFSDVVMPRKDGLAMLAELREAGVTTPVVMVSGQATVDMAVGPRAWAPSTSSRKPITTEKLLLTIENALRLSRLEEENQQLRRRVGRHEIVFRSEAMRRVMAQVDRVAPSESRVCILGETGTGKELVARAVHERSPRKDRPFVTVNCAAVPAELIESELFGHEKGAFTGAAGRHLGKFEQAHGGRSSSTRSATCRRRCRPSCCASCRKASSSASAANGRSSSTRASSWRRIAIWSSWSRRARSARTCSTASTSFRSRCRHCASGPTM